MSSAEKLGSSPRKPPSIERILLPLLDTLALGLWGILLLKYWLTGELNLLIHPNYFGLVIGSSFILLILAALRIVQLIIQVRQRRIVSESPHISFLPPSWSRALLIGTAILGLLIEPKVFTSQIAIQRGVTESLTTTRIQPQSFRSADNPEERSLIEWIRTLSVYPEPDEYTNQKVNVNGFVVYPPDLQSEYLLITRFVITCCAADAYPVSLPVKLQEKREAYQPDTWIEVKGQMMTETLKGKRQLVIEANDVKEILEPENPYSY
ncbi:MULTISPECIES: TIGR03943 family putative permease subunit [unclassified Coleofasciculus]|uniref:TIGR03943 family putative permease subunit n=1 Tax=unclassified Coleofasciculus TaxID=2692782 RepID=UPI00187F12F7|nr:MULTISPECIES: TIGR03943 family protein [unclassified Coleofasciculus]MBE9126449.1 TIGR03943 family protein [Coleofasciculus sp. LEGE 07081]MBE9148051.1 TIGR03943 family protein [Coleofasciculus sp. LEGE 07092]